MTGDASATAQTATMRAIEIAAPGGPEALRETRRPIPTPDPDSVLIQVAAAGVNRPDCLQRAGRYPPPPGASDLPGLEVAGVVVAVGAAVTTLAVGDAVCALTAGGGYAEYVVAAAAQCLPWPRGYDAVTAAALPETLFTVWSMVFERGRLQPGETLLVHGGASGIGVTAIQLACAFGATVLVTAGTAEKVAFCRALGAAHAIDYGTEAWPGAIRAATGGAGVDVILDMVAGPYVQPGLDLLAPDGRYLLLGFLGGATRTDLDLRRILTDRLTVTGAALRPQSAAAKAAIAAALRRRVWPLLDAGQCRPVIERVFPLHAAAHAHALMESNRHKGKIVLTVAAPSATGSGASV